MRVAAFAVAACLAAGLPTQGCAAATPAPPPRARVSEPRWQDAFDETPELLVVVRPRNLRQDKIYGPLLRRATQLARERSGIVSATPLEVLEDADEVVIGVHPRDRADDDVPPDLLLVVVGARADVDPGALTDATGHALWAAGPAGPVRELVRERDDHGTPLAASLFELPGRTWLIASGEIRAHVRESLAHPLEKPAMDLDPAALAIVRIDGPALVGRVRALQTLGSHAAIGRRLRALTLRLPPGVSGEVEISLAYADEDAAAFAELTTRDAVAAIARKKPDGLAWLGSATVTRAGKHVDLKTPLPRSLAEALLHGGPGGGTLEGPGVDGGAPPPR
jgi:hypothetical protein